MKQYPFKSMMISPRGFGNEGTFVYGNTSTMDEIQNNTNYGSRIYNITHHTSMANAKKASEKKCRDVGNPTTENYTCVMSASEYVSM